MPRGCLRFPRDCGYLAVADYLVSEGYQGSIYEMDKGLIDWINLGFKTEQGT